MMHGTQCLHKTLVHADTEALNTDMSGWGQLPTAACTFASSTVLMRLLHNSRSIGAVSDLC